MSRKMASRPASSTPSSSAVCVLEEHGVGAQVKVELVGVQDWDQVEGNVEENGVEVVFECAQVEGMDRVVRCTPQS